jgi:hypothetical protein
VRTNTARRLASAALLIALGVGLAAADAARVAFGVGVLRRDGIIVPFAAFDGKRWSSAWPPPSLDLTVPIDIRGVPARWWGPTGALQNWQAWTGGEPQSVRIVQPDWVNVHCVRQIGLRSDYRPLDAPPPRAEQPYPKDGLAVSPPQPVERIALVRPESSEGRALVSVVQAAFNKAERDVENRFGHPVNRRAREGREVDIEALYAVGERPRIYYVEATRRYRLLGQSIVDCEAIGFGTGWLVREGSDVRSLDITVDLLACNRVGATYMLPLGAIRAAGKLFWLAQFAGWNDERYVVVEIKPKSVEAVVNAWGGSCQR